jgi:hypothetical protein
LGVSVGCSCQASNSVCSIGDFALKPFVAISFFLQKMVKAASTHLCDRAKIVVLHVLRSLWLVVA